MSRSNTSHEKGQSLVLVTLMLFGFFAMLALTLDGGNYFNNRRAAQVAADAGALAGAREYCITESSYAAINAAWDYAVTRNQADAATSTVNPGSGDVTVNTSITFDTFFLGLFGDEELTATATATAGCSPPTSGLGVMPVAWSCRPPTEGSESEDCDILYMDHWENPGDGVCTAGEDPIYMIVDSEDIEDEVLCQDPPNSGTPEGTLDCDIDNDGVDDLILLSGGNRSWLDLDGGGGGASSLSGWIEDGLENPIYPHTWFAGQTGVAVSVYNTVNDHQLNNDVIVPVFDAICDGIPNNIDNCADLFHDHENPPGMDIVDEVVGNGATSADYFHVISFAIFRVECVQGGSNPGGGMQCPAHEAAELDPNVKTIEGCFVEGFDPGLGGGGGEFDLGGYVLYLKD